MWLRILGVLLILAAAFCGVTAWDNYRQARKHDDEGTAAAEKLKELGPGRLTVERENLELVAKTGPGIAREMKSEATLFLAAAGVLLFAGVGLLGVVVAAPASTRIERRGLIVATLFSSVPLLILEAKVPNVYTFLALVREVTPGL